MIADLFALIRMKRAFPKSLASSESWNEQKGRKVNRDSEKITKCSCTRPVVTERSRKVATC